MKTISFQSFWSQLDDACAVVMDGSEVTFHQIDADEDGEEFVLIETAQSGIEKFMERNNQAVRIRDDGIAVLFNEREEMTQIQMLAHKSFECIG